MHFHLEKLGVVAAFAIGGMGTAYAHRLMCGLFNLRHYPSYNVQ